MFIDLGILFSVRQITTEPIMPLTPCMYVYIYSPDMDILMVSNALDKSNNTAKVRFVMLCR